MKLPPCNSQLRSHSRTGHDSASGSGVIGVKELIRNSSTRGPETIWEMTIGGITIRKSGWITIGKSLLTQEIPTGKPLLRKPGNKLTKAKTRAEPLPVPCPSAHVPLAGHGPARRNHDCRLRRSRIPKINPAPFLSTSYQPHAAIPTPESRCRHATCVNRGNTHV